MTMQTTTDQMGQQLTLAAFPLRIVSLVPSQTELLYYWGLGERVVGITKFCIHPEEWYRNKSRVGGTKTVDLEKIAALKPDLIIGNKEENSKADIEQLQKNYPVWMSDLVTLPDVWDMFARLGNILQVQPQAQELTQQLQADFKQLNRLSNPIRVAYFIWQNPYMVAASGTFIDTILQAAGFVNVFAEQERYPSCTEKEIAVLQPDCILLSSEPYPFGEKHIATFQAICPQATIRVVDGELFSWYGSRLLHTVDYLQTLQQDLSL